MNQEVPPNARSFQGALPSQFGHGDTQSPSGGHWSNTALIALGSLWILIGLVANEWTIRYVLSLSQLDSLSRLGVWLMDCLCIAWGVLAIVYRGHQVMMNVNLLLVTVIVLAVSTECTLRLVPTVLGQQFANGVLTKYTWETNGIYYYDPVLKMKFMLPNFHTDMYFNGYRWIHETDNYGFRNPVNRDRADIVLLGDSNIYGHGVNVGHTVAHYIEQFSGYTVANLARQGDSAYEEAYVLTEYIKVFAPRYVIYFYCGNDISELRRHSDAELLEFIATPVDKIRYKSRMDVDEAIRRRGVVNEDPDDSVHSDSLLTVLRRKTYVGRIQDWLKWRKDYEKGMRKVRDPRYDDRKEESIGWKYTKHAINYMNFIAHKHNATFIIGPPIIHSEFHWRVQHLDILRKIAGEGGIDFIEGPLLDADRSLLLPKDGHLSDKGAQTWARLVVDYLKGMERPSASS